MTKKTKNLFDELDLIIEFSKYKSIMLNVQDNEYLWGYFEAISKRYLNNDLSSDDMNTLEDLTNVLMNEHKNSYLAWCRNRKIKGLL